MHIAIITAGGAGMFCGSCMHDNSWAKGLRAAGVEVSLLPMYTPIRVDEADQSSTPVFFGGINCYLSDRFGWWQRVPRFLTRWLDSPAIIRLATKNAVSNDAKLLGSMTVSMLRGEEGPHRRAGEELVDYVRQLRPDVVCFSNSMLCSTLRTLKTSFPGRTYCVLQGDDIFLDGLIEPYRSQVMNLLRKRVADFDGFLTHSRYYRDYMAEYLNQPVGKFHQLPLAIDCSVHDGRPKPSLGDPPTVGYFARICPEKGLDRLVEAVLLLRQRLPNVRLRAGGYLGAQHRAYFDNVCRRAALLGDAFEYIGSPETKSEKIEFLKSLDVFSVPTAYREPKGLYVLEAWANGLPVVLPRHGAFPQLVESTAGGLLVEPGDSQALAEALERVLTSATLRAELAERGHAGVRREHDLTSLARATLTTLG
jgi:glycosyltransferase involved in cell wall biosynthesis